MSPRAALCVLALAAGALARAAAAPSGLDPTVERIIENQRLKLRIPGDGVRGGGGRRRRPVLA